MPTGRRLASVFAHLLSKQQQHVQAGNNASSTNNHGNRTGQEQPVAIGVPPSDNASQAEEREHRRAEQRYWKWSIALTLLTIALTSVGIYVANSALKASWRAVDEARRQAEIARLSLIASDRPWLQVTTFQPNMVTIDASAVDVPTAITIRNVGHSPALNVRIVTDLLANGPGGDFNFPEKGFCDFFGGGITSPFTNIVFPNEESVYDATQNFFRIAIPDVLSAQGKDINNVSASSFGATFLLIGCATYEAATTGMKRYSTSFGLLLNRKCPQAPFGCAFEILQETKISGNLLQLRTPFKGNTAD